ncbi:LPS export ABC transporter periplasmic protein LptC [Longimicrobium terrae]|uniref:LPS export ABC transporter protein LptC n=1 Tax=Longimicrobium terrae TaxID=1639882 RepID=A0A841H4L9_9BACT|nr:LPS export ABC transporter periplasmic protein LptC [Longimicrobium terrae]MBB4638678.1 LPS export ABC transporter protein LptC [Longimicrobium terrae]MBB6072918.1 LPS export ABC transporter protein LptC [Longimicrobium terrae]NNC31530.1 LPS export ABC transporter periplasmic protein LptC [Longimicrobium terrae]
MREIRTIRFVTCVLALIPVLAACGPDGPAAPAVPAADVDGTQRTYGLNLKLSDAGILKADLFGDTAYQRPNTRVTELRGVKLTFYDKEGKNPGKLTSKTGEYDESTQVMIARGNVVLVTRNPKGETRTIRSEELHYDQRGDRVWSERETIVEEAGRVFTSQGFNSDTRFTNVQGRGGKASGVQVNAGAGSF